MLYKEGYNKISSWDHDNLMKSKQNKSWTLILNQIDIKKMKLKEKTTYKKK
jgi:TPP-dependent 2-oxoacid decarboxylase